MPEPVNAPGTTSLREDIGQAREQIASESGGGVDDAAAADTKPIVPEGADQKTAEDFIENLSAEDLAAINADPRLSRAYKLMLKDYRGKTTSVAEARKALETKQAELAAKDAESDHARQLYDALKDSPDDVIRALAQRRGLTIAEAKAAVKEAVTDPELADLFGADADSVAPSFNKAVEKRVMQIVDKKLGPVIQHLDAEAERQMRDEVHNDIETFRNKLKSEGREFTPEIESAMEKLTADLDPGRDKDGKPISNAKYLQYLYDIVTSGKPRAEVTKEVVRQMNKNIRDLEPKDLPTGGASPSSTITPDMNLRQSIRAARAELKGGH